VYGPNLLDVVGRPADSVAGFEYSAAMMAAREAGLIWTVENLDGFLVNPTQFLRDFLGDKTVPSERSLQRSAALQRHPRGRPHRHTGGLAAARRRG
jgi:hypothetical protein